MFSKPYEPFRGDINVKNHWYNYATKIDFKKSTGVGTSYLGAKSDFASLKAEIDKVDADKLKNTPIDLSKLCDVISKKVIKKTL